MGLEGLASDLDATFRKTWLVRLQGVGGDAAIGIDAPDEVAAIVKAALASLAHDGRQYRCLWEAHVDFVHGPEEGDFLRTGFCSQEWRPGGNCHWHVGTNGVSYAMTPELAETIRPFFDRYLARRANEAARVVGVGGVFVPAEDPAALAGWYSAHLGLEFREDSDGNLCMDFFARDRDDPSVLVNTALTLVRVPPGTRLERRFMVNYQVKGIDALLGRLEASGVTVEVQDYEFGRFAWFADLEGNRVEVYEPK